MRQYDDVDKITTIRRNLLLSHKQFKAQDFDMKKAIKPAKVVGKMLLVARGKYLAELDRQDEGTLSDGAISACRLAALPFLKMTLPMAEEFAELEKEGGQLLGAKFNTVQFGVHHGLRELVKAWQT